jgi:hypothetical protein
MEHTHTLILIYVEKAFDEVQYSFLIEPLTKIKRI